METATGPLLDEANAAFIQRAVSIIVAARDARHHPAVARACGCRVSSDRREVTVFLSATQARAVLDCLGSTGVIAVVFSRPSTHRTLQLKGWDARVVPIADGDLECMAEYRTSFVRDLTSLGYTEAFADAVIPRPDARLTGVRFTPGAAFDQTPGRNAGKPLA